MYAARPPRCLGCAASWRPVRVPDAEKYKNEFFAAAFADAISIYLLSLYLDVDYYDLRERDYPLLAPSAMAERLRKVAELFPAESRIRVCDLSQAAELDPADSALMPPPNF